MDQNDQQAGPAETAAQAPKTSIDVGAFLKEARKKKNASLDEAKQHTKIPRKLLEALEDNRFGVFPAKAYLRGFLKNYCDYLDVDFDPLWAAMGEASAAPIEQTPKDAPAAKASAEAHPREKTAEGPLFDPQSIGAFAIAAVFAVAVAGWGIYSRHQRRAAETPAPLPSALRPLATATGNAVAVALNDPAWIKLVCDGAVQFEGEAPRRSRQSCKAFESAALKTSDSSAVEVSVNGSTLTLSDQDASGTYRIPLP